MTVHALFILVSRGEKDRYGHMSIQLLLNSYKTDSFDDHLCYHFTLNAVYRDDIKRHL